MLENGQMLEDGQKFLPRVVSSACCFFCVICFLILQGICPAKSPKVDLQAKIQEGADERFCIIDRSALTVSCGDGVFSFWRTVS